jgi:hypothetical protein
MEKQLGGSSPGVRPKNVGRWARMGEFLSVAEQSWWQLWLWEIGCILFTLLGIFLLLIDPKEWVIPTLWILACGCAAIIFAVKLILKWRLPFPYKDESVEFTDVPVVWGGKYVMEKDSGSKRGKYRVKDGLGKTVCLAEVEREPYCGLFRVTFLSVLVCWALFLHLELVSPKSPDPTNLMIILGIGLSLLGIMVAYSLKWKTFLVCRGGINNEPVLRIRYRCQLTLRGSGNYAIEGPSGELIGYLRPNGLIKGYFSSTGMKCYRPDLSLLCQISEPFAWSNVLWLLVGACFGGVLGRTATDFKVFEPTESRVIGTFGKNIIEVSPEANMDGRVSLAMGLMICDQVRYVREA